MSAPGELPSGRPDVIVVGAGIIGLATARELARAGSSVWVVDRGGVGQGCSYGNAGWITPCFAFPLPRPGMLLKAVGWLLDPDSPLYIHPDLGNPRLARWLVNFTVSMRSGKMLDGLKALVELSLFSLNEYQSLAQSESFGFEQKGLLMLALTQGGLKDCEEERRLVASLGVPGQLLTAEQIRKREPAVTGDIAGGVYFDQEAHCEPLAAVQALARQAEAAGARIVTGVEVFGFETQEPGGGAPSKVTGLRTTRGILRAENFVMATGSWSLRLAEKLGLRVPVLGGKGYAITAPKLKAQPTHPILVLEKKVAITPRADSLRMAGTLELVDGDESITTRRVEAIVRGARQVLTLPERVEQREVWRGLRPCTPDGLPILGPSPEFPNLCIATGHQMLGLQTAPASGRLAADLVLGRKPAFDPAPFRADRF